MGEGRGLADRRYRGEGDALGSPEKSAPIKAFCSAWYLAVPAPWKRIVLSLRELPRSWGLLEVGTGKPNVVLMAEERRAEEPTPGFLRALLRAASRDAAAAAELGIEDVAGAPLVEVNRPGLSHQNVGLECGHVVRRPLAKGHRPRLPCSGCANGRPPDREFIEAAIDDARDEDLRAFRQRIDERLRGAA